MDRLIIQGKNILSGTIEISGAKNSAVALIPAAILCESAIISNVPSISDIDALEEILNYLGANVKKQKNKIIINSKNLINKPIVEKFSNKLRASYYFMGALLGKYKRCEMYFPGGCPIGERPIDLHLSSFEKMGAKVENIGNKYIITTKELKGADINLRFPSVGATIDIILAAVNAKGITTINNAAIEPEVSNLIDFLLSMGADIEGRDTSILKINGKKQLKKGEIIVLPDRIEAGTYILAGALMGENLKINNIVPSHLESLINCLKTINVDIKINKNNVVVNRNKIINTNIKTEVYPGFPTDLQQPLTTLLICAQGTSTIEETIYENRFQNVKYLNEMGADITIKNQKIFIKGPQKLKGRNVIATDLRAGASLVLAGLYADGTTVIESSKHILRGYDHIVEKLKQVGANIKYEK